MNIGLIGLGKMGSSIAYRLIKSKINVIAFDFDKNAQDEAKKIGAQIAKDVADVAQETEIIWLMLPSGKAIDNTIEKLEKNLKPGNIIIDGGNSKFSDSMIRSEKLSKVGIYFLDCGTSGGLHGCEIGFSLMIGGNREAYEKAKPVFEAVAAPEGYGYMGLSGSGHYTKMIHNGIEYALMQAYAEGFHLLKDGKFKNLNLEEISRVWLHGSIIRSWILELAHEIFESDQDLSKVSGEVEHTGMGSWTVEEAKKQKIDVTLIEKALDIRKNSQKTGGNYATKIVALLRNKFGGHAVKNI